MHIDLRTVSIAPLRQTYNHIAERMGADKTASRYLEATMDLQAETNFHYRPTWDPEYEIHDRRRTGIQMQDWYDLKDPRKYYYGTYTRARARMEELADADYKFVEVRGLAAAYDDAARQAALAFYVPLRHVAWGGNMNGLYQGDYAFGTAMAQACLYAGMDQLGIAQYLTQFGLLMGGKEALDEAKQAWLEAPQWQPMRRLVEDSWVVKDWFELFVLQNVVLDGALFDVAYREVDAMLTQRAGPTVSMLMRFQIEWFEEVSKWVDSVIKTAAQESDANRVLLGQWYGKWRPRVAEALEPVAGIALQDDGPAAVARALAGVDARMTKLGLPA